MLRKLAGSRSQVGLFLGPVLFLIFFITLATLPSLGMENLLYLYSVPEAPYSAMNGWGHYVLPLVSVFVYCLALGLLMIVVAHLAYQRGAAAGVSERLTIARSRFSPLLAGVTAFALLASFGTGGWIYYNTHVLNDYLTSDDREELQADYEKAYKRFEKLPLPQVVDIDIAVDLFPEQRRLESTGTAILVNRHATALDELHLTLPRQLVINELEVKGAELVQADETLEDHNPARAETRPAHRAELGSLLDQ